jgi:sigma54-dependent transcription regulator
MIFMSDHKEQLGSLADSITHLLKITRSYWSGLFHCYQIDNLPKTNNDLRRGASPLGEQVFGSFRHHTRRTTGRKKAPSSTLIRGSSRLIAAVVTRIKTFTAKDLASVDLVSWRHQRLHLEQLRQKRLQQRRFRCDPENYLLELETKLIQSILPP